MRLATYLHAQQKNITTKNTSNMEQTAVEWFESMLKNWDVLLPEIKKAIIEQSKEIEKYQIVQAFNHGRNVGSVGSPNVDGNYYYKQIFKSE